MAANKGTPAQRSAHGRKGKNKSPWAKQAHCDTFKARRKYAELKRDPK